MILFVTTPGVGQSILDHFVFLEGDKLMDGEEELRFISFNVPCLHYLEDCHPIEAASSHRLPDEFEIGDALKSLK